MVRRLTTGSMEEKMDAVNSKDIETHISVVGWAQIVNSVINILVAAFVVAVLVVIGAIADDPIAYRFLATLGWLTGALLFFLALPGLVVGIGLLGRARWSRVVGMGIAVFELGLFPIGTLLGIYTIFILSQHAAAEAFGPCCSVEESRLRAAGAGA
jgi:hypothetical protein